MKQKSMMRCLSLLLAGILLVGNPLLSFASEQNQDLLETSEDNVDAVNEGQKDETATDGEQKNDEAIDEEQENDEASVDEDQNNVTEENGGRQDDQVTGEPAQEPSEAESDDPVNKGDQEEFPIVDDTEKEEGNLSDTDILNPVEEQNPKPDEEQEKGTDLFKGPDDGIDTVEEAADVLMVQEVSAIVLDPTPLVLSLRGKPGILTAKVYDQNGKEITSGVSFSWMNQDNRYATYQMSDIDGVITVTPKSVGETDIMVQAGGKRATCKVKVIIPVESLSLDKTSLSMKKKQVTELHATVSPQDTTENKSITWSSSNPNVAVVDAAGKITAKAGGTAVIKAATADGHSAECRVSVSNEEWRTGWQKINNKWYYYNEQSVMQTGWQQVDGSYYYMDGRGVMQTGWLMYDGRWYYLNDNGSRRSGWLNENGKWYYMDENGVMQTGLARAANGCNFYFTSSGVLKTGWQQASGTWYYIDLNRGALTGWQKINSKWYYMDRNGAMQTGWQLVAGQWYYLDSQGVMETGWKRIKNKWYYLTPGNGAMKIGWQRIGNKWYYFTTGNGAMQTGWLELDGTWYYLTPSDGAMKTGWQKINNKWYYLNPKNGVMKTGWQKIDNKYYYLNPDNGAMKTGWQEINDKWYYLDSSGVMKTGWVTVNNKKYYMNSNGVMKTGWQPVGGKFYYFNEDGSMRTGWLRDGDIWYYLKSNGTMATSDTMIDGKNNAFNENGEWEGVIKTKIRSYGIDVHHGTGDINWKKVAGDNIDFAMIRVVSGGISDMKRDESFKEYYDGARDAGIKVGVYRYSYATSRTQARKEADAVIKALNGRELDYPVVLDVEYEGGIMSSSISNERRTEIILAFKKEIEDAGYKFALYANLNHLNTKLEEDLLEDMDIWIARYRDLDAGHGYKGEGNVVMWQYSDKGSVKGISGNVDLNVSYKKY